MPDQQGSTWSPEVVADQFFRKGGGLIGGIGVDYIRDALIVYKKSGDVDYSGLCALPWPIEEAIIKELGEGAGLLDVSTQGGLFNFFKQQKDAGNDVLPDILKRAAKRGGDFFDVTRQVLREFDPQKVPDATIQQFCKAAQSVLQLNPNDLSPEQLAKIGETVAEITQFFAAHSRVNDYRSS